MPHDDDGRADAYAAPAVPAFSERPPELVVHGCSPCCAGYVRPPQRARRLRRRFRRHPHRRGVPHPGRAGPHRSAQPRTPRRHRIRAGLRRRRGNPLPGARRLLPRGGRIRTARGGRLRGRYRLPAGGRHRRRRGPDRGHRRRRGPDRPRLARGAGRAPTARRHRPFHDAGVPPDLRRCRGEPGDRARPQGVRAAQARRARGGRLLPVPVGPHDRLQGHADHRPARALLPGPVRPPLRLRHRARALPVLHEHLPVVAARAPVPLHRAQR